MIESVELFKRKFANSKFAKVNAGKQILNDVKTIAFSPKSVSTAILVVLSWFAGGGAACDSAYPGLLADPTLDDQQLFGWTACPGTRDSWLASV